MPSPLPLTLAAVATGELEVKRSRFLTEVHPVASPHDADAVVAGLRRRYDDARHHCVAAVFGLHGENARSDDDGEPGGTAGMPMLEVLRRRSLTDVVAVVARYFGGVKLGAGGLVRAYSGAVSATLDSARLLERRRLVSARVSVPHAEAGRLDNQLRAWAAHHDAAMGEPTYAADASLEVWVPEASRDALTAEVVAATAGTAHPVFGAERIIDVPV